MHYTREPLTFDRSRTYGQRRPYEFGKPVGFWGSVAGEDDWPSWCRDQGSFLDSLTHGHEVTLAGAADVLRIDTATGIDRFHDTYSTQSGAISGPNRKFWPVDWGRVAQRWDGIIIAPYQWSHRYDGPSWYYGWDVASGCIWNLDAIADVRLVAEVAS